MIVLTQNSEGLLVIQSICQHVQTNLSWKSNQVENTGKIDLEILNERLACFPGLARVVICNSWAWQGALPSTPAPDVRLNPIRDTQFPSKEGVHKNKTKQTKHRFTKLISMFLGVFVVNFEATHLCILQGTTGNPRNSRFRSSRISLIHGF